MTPPGHQLPPAASSYERRGRHRIPWFIDPSAALGWRGDPKEVEFGGVSHVAHIGRPKAPLVDDPFQPLSVM